MTACYFPMIDPPTLAIRAVKQTFGWRKPLKEPTIDGKPIKQLVERRDKLKE